MDEDPEGQHPRLIITPISFDKLSGDDLRQLRDQAAELVGRFEGSGRLTEDLVFLLAKAATDEAESRFADDTEWEHHLYSVIDETSPAEQVKDDLGTLMAHALAMFDRNETRPAVRAVWLAFIGAVRSNREALQAAGVSM